MTDEKSNEITAIPELLRKINIKNQIVTIDAMGTQKEIARIIKKEPKPDYVLAVKGNQGNLHNDRGTFKNQTRFENPTLIYK